MAVASISSISIFSEVLDLLKYFHGSDRREGFAKSLHSQALVAGGLRSRRFRGGPRARARQLGRGSRRRGLRLRAHQRAGDRSQRARGGGSRGPRCCEEQVRRDLAQLGAVDRASIRYSAFPSAASFDWNPRRTSPAGLLRTVNGGLGGSGLTLVALKVIS
jgi:hypothetical protein